MSDDLRPGSESCSEHIEVFAERYDQLFATARSLANNDQGQARDLVHDALLVFVRRNPDLHKINNIDGYLHRLVFNLAKSQKRRLNVQLIYELSIESYDSVEIRVHEMADRYRDPHLLLQMQDMLRIICEYACFRKESLKLGSVLILRFFHGYHTSEIAQIMQVTASAVSQLLKLARAEACLYLNDPKQLNFSHKIACMSNRSGLSYGCLVDDLVDELRRAIFQPPCSRKCLFQFKLHKLYGGKRQEEIDCETLAHIVSCERCLDAVNTFLGLELLSMRYPADTLGKRTKDGKMFRRAMAGRGTVTRRAILSSPRISYGD